MRSGPNRSRRTNPAYHRAWFVPYLFLAPGAVLLVIWNYIPAFYAIWISLTNAAPGNHSQFIGLANYVQLLSDPSFWNSLLRSLEYLLVVPVLVIIPLLVAMLLNQRLPGIGVFRALYFLPVVVSMVVVAIVFSEIFQTIGLLNVSLMSLHLLKQPISWLALPSLAIFVVMLVTVWKGIGYYIIVYLAGLQTVPKELIDSAKVDGANLWARVRHVTVPLIWPFMMFVMIISTLGAMQVFTEIYVLTGGGPLQTTTTLLFYVWQKTFSSYRFGYGAAAGEVIFVLLVALSYVEFRLSGRRWTT